MTASHETRMLLKIMVGEYELLRGDERSAVIIFNNLSGANFQDTISSPASTHEDYLACRIRRMDSLSVGILVPPIVGNGGHWTQVNN